MIKKRSVSRNVDLRKAECHIARDTLQYASRRTRKLQPAKVKGLRKQRAFRDEHDVTGRQVPWVHSSVLEDRLPLLTLQRHDRDLGGFPGSLHVIGHKQHGLASRQRV